MGKENLINLLNGIFIPFGFKRKNNNWVLNDEEISKIINLQKSEFSNSFYINYDYIIRNLPLNGLKFHITNRLSSANIEEQNYITSLLNFENNIPLPERLKKLEHLIKTKIIDEVIYIHSEQDLSELLKKRKVLYTVPQFVLSHFQLNNDSVSNL